MGTCSRFSVNSLRPLMRDSIQVRRQLSMKSLRRHFQLVGLVQTRKGLLHVLYLLKTTLCAFTLHVAPDAK
ncbi:Hypothetical protein PHPALM_36468 [Phytophthora palmivora]|uniref:Uncharacterized protein n=1 Tax=Phytophthora palmivora TaxID=4796 RepID=A0A2P4WZV8_9STRA|nr:Hypothetical protein PHPALM_36468 [Phytophthora palmivora]